LAKKRRRVFSDRKLLGFPEWYERFYGTSGLSADNTKTILYFLGSALQVEPGRLRHTEGLESECKLFNDGLGGPLEAFWEDLDDLIIKTTGRHIKVDPAWRTLDDVIRACVSEIQSES
jgi:hypothetical protein